MDIPRGATQVGSLVVCLPYPREEGQLRISHQGHDTSFDWSPDSATTVQWAAFYTDCEYEVLEVTSGHRVTLTYNLYAYERTGALMRECTIIDSRHFDVYHRVVDVMTSA